MDSWTDQQLALMRNGGNDKLNSYLAQRGISKDTPIKQKYESDAAQLYKLVLKARVEGKLEPTQLPKIAPKSGGAAGARGGGDANGMERLPGETDQQYIARQTRLRDEAKARMASKFGGSGMGGVGSGGGRSSMQGIGSDPSYDPNRSASSGLLNVDSLVTGLGSAISSAGSMASNVKNSVLSQENMNSVRSTSSSFWGSLTSGVSNVANSVTSPGETGNDGLADLQRQFASQKPSQSKYGGMGSDAFRAANKPSIGTPPANTASAGSGTQQEAPGLPGEDRNGIARLTGESDEQYVMRQTRLRDEARQRMAGKFGDQATLSSASGGGLGSHSSSNGSLTNGGVSNTASTLQEAPGVPGEDRNGIARLTGESDDQYVMRQTRLREEARARMAAKFGNGGAAMSSASSNSAPPSGNAKPSWLSQPTAPASGGLNSTDFFSSFGS